MGLDELKALEEELTLRIGAMTREMSAVIAERKSVRSQMAEIRKAGEEVRKEQLRARRESVFAMREEGRTWAVVAENHDISQWTAKHDYDKVLRRKHPIFSERE